VPDAAKGMVKTLTVTAGADTTATPPAADLRMELVDFSFIIEGEPAAEPQVVEIANTGRTRQSCSEWQKAPRCRMSWRS
jgi:hypothetical protein